MNTRHCIDTEGSRHTLATESTGIILDGKPGSVIVKDSQITLISSDSKREGIIVAPAALWQACAGGSPTPEAAGLLLAEMLARHGAMQEIAELVLHVRPLLDEIERHISQHNELPLPAYRFSSFVSQVLETLDGTEEQTLAVARILKQLPETIHEWAAQMGKNIPLPGHCPVANQDHRTAAALPHTNEQQVGREPSDGPVTEKLAPPTGDGRRGKPGYTWTHEHERLLEEAYKTSQQGSTNAKIKEIAARFDWPFHVVDYRMRQLTKRQQQQPEVQALQEESSEVEPLADDTHPGPAEEKQSGSLLLLPVGAFLWDVKIDGTLHRWPLDIVYGTFPCAAGSHVIYREKVYVLQQVWHSIIEVASVGNAHSPTVMELVEV